MTGKPRDPFTGEDLQKYWEEFLFCLQEENNIPTYNALSTGKVELKDEFKIEFTFGSSSLETEFEQQKERLVNLLRERLNNYGIEISVKVVQNKTVKYVQTKDEIFDEMAQKNPVLRDLKNRFKLDLE